MQHPNPDMLVRIAQADAYAMALEYVDAVAHPELLARALRFERYLAHPTHHRVAAGSYTDDTQMSVAVAEVLLSCAEPTAHDFGDAFFRCYARDPRHGYSRGFQALLERVRSADELRAALGARSDKNGAAMRSVPIGLLPDVERVVAIASVQAAVTHDTRGGIDSAVAVALMSHFAHHEGDGFDSMHRFCTRASPAFAPFARSWNGPVGVPENDKLGLGVGMCTAWAVSTLLVEETSLLAMMRRLLRWGGDTDSVAAIAWGIASARYPSEQLPAFFERDLEVGRPYGVEFLRDLGRRLMPPTHAGS